MERWVMCVGGKSDGRKVLVNEGQDTIKIPVKLPLRLSPEDFIKAMEYEIYKLEKICFKYDDIEFLIPIDADVYASVLKVFQAYNKPL